MLKQNEIQAMIDEVVARVVNQMGQNQGAAESAARVLQARVITTAQVPNENESGSVVIVRQDAVITPAAKDLFQDRGIRVQHVPVKAGQSGRETLSAELLVPPGTRSQIAHSWRKASEWNTSSPVWALQREKGY